MKYTNGTYVYQDGKVYYRRYHEDSYEEIVCIDADGMETEGFLPLMRYEQRFCIRIRRKRMSKWKQAVVFLFSGFCLSACGKDEPETVTEIITIEETTTTEEPETAPDELSLTAEMNLSDIEQEIDEYRMHFIELYTSNAMDETEDRINIEEMEIDYGDNGEPATLIKYTDLSGEKLRYQLQFYGETGRYSIDYYLCKDFVLISRKNDYYSSWVLTAGYSDVLYSTIENWIVIDENVYILHSDGELEKIEKTQLETPALEEIEAFGLTV